MNEIIEENKRLQIEVDRLISKNMDFANVIRDLRKNAREDADAMTAQKLWAETIRETCLNLEKERERDELAALLAAEKATRNSIIEKGVKTERERDEARAERDILRSNKMSDPLLETTFKHLNRERDEACEVANGLAKQVERLCKECDEARQQLRIAVGLLSTQPQFANKHPEDVLAFVKEVAK